MKGLNFLNFRKLGTSNNLFENIFKVRVIIPRPLTTTPSTTKNDANLKSKRQLKKEARDESKFGDNARIYLVHKFIPSSISARKLRSNHSITESTNRITDSNDDDNSSLTFIKDSSSTQQNIIQRLSRAIIKCDDNVPHNYLSSTFVRIVNISVSTESNIANIWWKPDPQKGINEVG
ncbi:4155_t:CDS:2 [Funneliformis caledonium]|uniref:4155_t:CDS:1 n=1 Tax=Funneliformis caledonium TaxID=1117310 RepID=A0A9N9FDQ7_9GLOM|nr:4155_t:CDS:2 [Funneliformis caledonium]